jgi:hypothetical protein
MGMIAFYAGLIMGALVGVVLMALWSRVGIKEGVLEGEARTPRHGTPPSLVGFPSETGVTPGPES